MKQDYIRKIRNLSKLYEYSSTDKFKTEIPKLGKTSLSSNEIIGDSSAYANFSRTTMNLDSEIATILNFMQGFHNSFQSKLSSSDMLKNIIKLVIQEELPLILRRDGRKYNFKDMLDVSFGYVESFISGINMNEYNKVFRYMDVFQKALHMAADEARFTEGSYERYCLKIKDICDNTGIHDILRYFRDERDAKVLTTGDADNLIECFEYAREEVADSARDTAISSRKEERIQNGEKKEDIVLSDEEIEEKLNNLGWWKLTYQSEQDTKMCTDLMRKIFLDESEGINTLEFEIPNTFQTFFVEFEQKMAEFNRTVKGGLATFSKAILRLYFPIQSFDELCQFADSFYKFKKINDYEIGYNIVNLRKNGLLELEALYFKNIVCNLNDFSTNFSIHDTTIIFDFELFVRIKSISSEAYKMAFSYLTTIMNFCDEINVYSECKTACKKYLDIILAPVDANTARDWTRRMQGIKKLVRYVFLRKQEDIKFGKCTIGPKTELTKNVTTDDVDDADLVTFDDFVDLDFNEMTLEDFDDDDPELIKDFDIEVNIENIEDDMKIRIMADKEPENDPIDEIPWGLSPIPCKPNHGAKNEMSKVWSSLRVLKNAALYSGVPTI